MALSKVTYVDGVTIIGAKNLNDIQDELIRQGEQQAEDEAELALKADEADMQTALALKADKSDTYTKAEVNEALGLKANTADVNEALALKADKTDTYTKAQVDSMIQEAVEEAVKESEYSNFEMKSVSGDFIHITDGAGLIPVKDLKIDIDAVQDLHGYDAPWVGGAGKNLLPMGSLEGIKSRNTNGTWNGNVYTYNGLTITVLLDNGGNVIGFKANGTTTAAVSFRVVSEATYVIPAGEYILTGTNEVISDYDLNLRESGSFSDITQRGTPKAFTLEADTTFSNAYLYVYGGRTLSNIEFYPMVRLASVADGSFAPYSNICPISGWTGAKVSVSGINQWDDEWEVGGISTTTGQNAGSTNSIRSKNYIRVLPSTDYYLKCGNPETYLWFYGKNKEFLSFSTSTPNSVFTTPSNCHYIRIRSGGSSHPATTYNHDISINYPSTDTGYHAYDGHVYEVTWEDEAGTVYGGTLDVTTGELVVTHAEVDLGSLDYTYIGSGNGARFDTSIADMLTPSTSAVPNAICSQYVARSWSTVGTDADHYFACYIDSINNQHFAIRDTNYSDAIAFKNALIANDAQLVYELDEPISFTIDPTEVLTLLGENNIFADTGAVEELIYRISRQ